MRVDVQVEGTRLLSELSEVVESNNNPHFTSSMGPFP